MLTRAERDISSSQRNSGLSPTSVSLGISKKPSCFISCFDISWLQVPRQEKQPESRRSRKLGSRRGDRTCKQALGLLGLEDKRESQPSGIPTTRRRSFVHENISGSQDVALKN
ncbi:hypothetical protein WG66_012969 [Moniliophthora roreri]|nr:hypothetical protein WG66_012969 [Moniliophthora roreri]